MTSDGHEFPFSGWLQLLKSAILSYFSAITTSDGHEFLFPGWLQLPESAILSYFSPIMAFSGLHMPSAGPFLYLGLHFLQGSYPAAVTSA